MLVNTLIQSIQSGTLLAPLYSLADEGMPLTGNFQGIQDSFCNVQPLLAGAMMAPLGIVARGMELVRQKLFLKGVREKLLSAERVTVLTGAGVSAESGVSTFRGSGGFWKNRKADQLATPQAFDNDSTLVWKFYQERREKLLGVQPNAGHKALTDFEKFKGSGFTLLTQNVDGLHRLAGSVEIAELHGNIWQVRCTRCDVIEEDRRVPFPELPPTCKHCGGILRPNIVWFGESYDSDVYSRMQAAVENCDVFLVVGTSGIVHPAAALREIASLHGAYTIEVNLEETPASEEMDISFRGKSGEILPKLLRIPK